MTLCVAATCQYEDEPCIVHCCDFAGTRGQVTSEDTDKIDYLGDNTVLKAGSLSAARELLIECELAIRKHKAGDDELSLQSAITALREAAGKRKREIADAYLQTKYAMSFEVFKSVARRQFTETHYLQVWDEINKLNLQAELIVSTFSDDEAVILRVSMDGAVTWENHYATAGTGSDVCQAFLCQREYDDEMELRECLYRVLEAKIAAEKAPYVGQATAIEVAIKGKHFDVKDRAVNALIFNAERHIRAIPKIRIDDDFLVERTDDEAGAIAHSLIKQAIEREP